MSFTQSPPPLTWTSRASLNITAWVRPQMHPRPGSQGPTRETTNGGSHCLRNHHCGAIYHQGTSARCISTLIVMAWPACVNHRPIVLFVQLNICLTFRIINGHGHQMLLSHSLGSLLKLLLYLLLKSSSPIILIFNYSASINLLVGGPLISFFITTRNEKFMKVASCIVAKVLK